MLEAYGVDISAEVEELKQEIPMAPLPDDLMGPAAEIFLKSALDLGYDCGKLNKFIDQSRCKPNCDKCSYGCPFKAKWCARDWVELAVDNGGQINSPGQSEQGDCRKQAGCGRRIQGR